jgi:hypothetical protein
MTLRRDMMNKLIIGTIAAAALMVALSPVVANQVVSAFPGENGQGHQTTQTTTCTQTQSGSTDTGTCSGSSYKSPNKDETTTTTTTAGHSTNVKDQSSITR